jgi:hypothetical protein
MIRPKGEAGTGDIVNAVNAHKRRLRRHPQARKPALRRAAHRGEEPPGAVRARQLSGGERPAARGHVHRRRDRHTRRCSALHAVRRGRRLRRLGRSSSPATRRSARRRPSRRRYTSTTRRSSRASPPGSARGWSGSSRGGTMVPPRQLPAAGLPHSSSSPETARVALGRSPAPPSGGW